MEATTFTCSICGDTSRDICVYCTKDACSNHLCERCRRCSDCCVCETQVFTQATATHTSMNGHKSEALELSAFEKIASEPEA